MPPQEDSPFHRSSSGREDTTGVEAGLKKCQDADLLTASQVRTIMSSLRRHQVEAVYHHKPSAEFLGALCMNNVGIKLSLVPNANTIMMTEQKHYKDNYSFVPIDLDAWLKALETLIRDLRNWNTLDTRVRVVELDILLALGMLVRFARARQEGSTPTMTYDLSVLFLLSSTGYLEVARSTKVTKMRQIQVFASNVSVDGHDINTYYNHKGYVLPFDLSSDGMSAVGLTATVEAATHAMLEQQRRRKKGGSRNDPQVQKQTSIKSELSGAVPKEQASIARVSKLKNQSSKKKVDAKNPTNAPAKVPNAKYKEIVEEKSKLPEKVEDDNDSIDSLPELEPIPPLVIGNISKRTLAKSAPYVMPRDPQSLPAIFSEELAHPIEGDSD